MQKSHLLVSLDDCFSGTLSACCPGDACLSRSCFYKAVSRVAGSCTFSRLTRKISSPPHLTVLQGGEIMDGRYEVFATHGKGVFSTVLRARDKKAQTMTGVTGEVAIKMIRANDTMFTAGQVGWALPGCGQVTCSNPCCQEQHVCVQQGKGLCTPQGRFFGFELLLALVPP